MNSVATPCAFPVLVLVYYYSYYLMASNTAHVAAIYSPFLTADTPPWLAALVLGLAGNLFGSTPHYGRGPAPVFFGPGYVPLGVWWRRGAVIRGVPFLIWGGVGSVGWKLIEL